MGTELEWKYAVPAPALLDEILAWEEVQSRMAEEPRRYHMQSEYYDTPDRSLSRRRITLRRRLENETAVFCVKAPLRGAADLRLRGEWETEAEDLAAALPRLAALGAPELLTEASLLHVLCHADFLRRALLLRFDDGSRAELALDLGTLSGWTRSLPLCEMELELKSGEPAAARAFAEALAARFSLPPEPMSKFARASALARMHNALCKNPEPRIGGRMLCAPTTLNAESNRFFTQDGI